MSRLAAEKRIAVMLVDDHLLVRRGFRRMLEDDPDIDVVAEAGDGQEAVDLASRTRPDVVVMDFALPSMNGAVATRQDSRRSTRRRHVDPEHAFGSSATSAIAWMRAHAATC